MALKASVIMLGVKDLARSKAFYEALGCALDKEYPGFVSFKLGDGSSELALYPWGQAAQDAGVPAEGSGFRGVSFHYLVGAREAVDETMKKAIEAGGKAVKDAAAAQWGGYFGYFSDPDGYLWKVASQS